MVSFASIQAKVEQRILGMTVYGLEVQFLAEGGHRCFVSQLAKKKNSLTIESTRECQDLETAFELLRKKPVVLCLSGKGVICKRIEAGDQRPIEDHFPGMEWDSVEIRRYVSENEEWVGFIRKDLYDSIRDPLKQKGVRIIQLELGGISLLQNLALFGTPPDRLQHHLFQWNGTSLLDYRFEEKTRDELSDYGEQFYQQPLAFSMSIVSAIEFFKNDVRSILSAGNQSLKEFLLFRLRSLASIGFIALLFSALLINFFVLQRTREGVAEVEGELEWLSQAEALKKTQRQDALSDLKLFGELIGPKNTSYTEILESVARVVPSDLVLTGLDIHPQSRRKQQSPVFQKGNMRLEGKAMDLGDLNTFIESLADYSWTGEIKLDELLHSDKTGEHHFKLLVEL